MFAHRSPPTELADAPCPDGRTWFGLLPGAAAALLGAVGVCLAIARRSPEPGELHGAVVLSALLAIGGAGVGWAWRRRPYAPPLVAFLAGLAVLRVWFIVLGPLELSPDEAHYWDWSRRIDWGYYSKGPAVAWVIRLGTRCFGQNVLGVRGLAPVLSALNGLLLYRLGAERHDERTGALAAALLQVVPIFAVYAVGMSIDAPYLFFWILSMYLLHRADRGTGRSTWLLLGLAVGMGMLTKYTMVLFYPSALAFLLSCPRGRRQLGTVWPWLAAAVSLLVLVPLIAWNVQHDWVNLQHNLRHAQAEKGLVVSPAALLHFVGGQLGVITPLLAVMALIALVRRRRDDPFSFWLAVPTLGLFLLKSAHARVQPNWALTGWVTPLVALAAAFARRSPPPGARARWCVRIALVIAVAATALLHVPHLPGLLGVPAHRDPLARAMMGWEALGREVSRLKRQLPQPCFLLADSYQVSSELAFYVEHRPVTYCVNLGHRRMNQYDVWPGFHELKGYSAIFVWYGGEDLPRVLARAFDSCEPRSFTAVDRAGRTVRQCTIFLCRGFKGMDKNAPDTY